MTLTKSTRSHAPRWNALHDAPRHFYSVKNNVLPANATGRVAHGFSRGIDDIVKHIAPTSKEVGHRFDLHSLFIPKPIPYNPQLEKPQTGQLKHPPSRTIPCPQSGQVAAF